MAARSLQLIGLLASLAWQGGAAADPLETMGNGAPAIDSGAFRISGETLYTVAGAPVTVFHYFAVGPDCAARPVTITVTSPPAHGKLAFSEGAEAPVWAGRPLWTDTDPRARCLGRLVTTRDGAYAPDPGFSGKDELTVTFTDGAASFSDAIEVNVVTLAPPPAPKPRGRLHAAADKSRPKAP